jgi:UDP-N-acetylmuramate dehydrogenase
MSFPDLVGALRSKMPALRGRLLPNQPLADLTWFRVGGPAQVLFIPEHENDLCYFLRELPTEIPVTTIGLGSNLIVRDGGVAGVVVRLGRGFNEVSVDGLHVRTGAAVPDVKVARAAQEAGIAGLSFLRGIPGSIGGALRMNGGAYGGETKDILVDARGVDRGGNARTYSNAEMNFSYRHCGVPDDVIFTQALFVGRRGDAADQEPHRRFDVQESARAQGMAIGRCRRLPRVAHRRRADLRDALQFLDQSRQRDGGRDRDTG